jgi:hypothetical protein
VPPASWKIPLPRPLWTLFPVVCIAATVGLKRGQRLYWRATANTHSVTSGSVRRSKFLLLLFLFVRFKFSCVEWESAYRPKIVSDGGSGCPVEFYRMASRKICSEVKIGVRTTSDTMKVVTAIQDD